MIRIRPAGERGEAHYDWLDTRYSFSFADYYDPVHMGYSSLRVINEDRIAPGGGFPTHGHRDMEIITYVLEGALEHRDSLGNGSVIRPGDIQRMSAGRGIRHSEYNPSENEPTHLLQIWLLPEENGIEPGYEQIRLEEGVPAGRLRLVACRASGEGVVKIHQDAALYVGRLAPGQSVTQPLAPGRSAWVQVARGRLDLNGTPLAGGDGAAVADEGALRFIGESDAEVLVFDLP